MSEFNTPSKPVVKIGTENDDAPPLIIEDPDLFFASNDEVRSDYREATAGEYQRYRDHYNALDEE